MSAIGTKRTSPQPVSMCRPTRPSDVQQPVRQAPGRGADHAMTANCLRLTCWVLSNWAVDWASHCFTIALERRHIERLIAIEPRGTFELSGGSRGGSGKYLMKIAQIAPLIESVPPRLYGGTERIVSYLTEELVALGHEVTLFASGDLITAANLVPCVPKALRLDASVRDPIPYYMLMLDRVRQRADDFDVLHFHIDQFQFPLFRPIAGRTVTTLHGRQDLPDLLPLYVGFDDMPLVSISNAQRLPVPNANFAATVYHGLPVGLHRPIAEPRGGYVAFLGRISPEKRPDRAIKIARALGIPLKIAAKVDRVDDVYFRTQIEPLLEAPASNSSARSTNSRRRNSWARRRRCCFPSTGRSRSASP